MFSNRNLILSIFTSLALIISISGCEVVEGIFNVGFWVGVIVVVVIVLIILWILKKVK